MKNYNYVISFELNDNSGNEEQYTKLRDTLVHLLKREDEAGNLLDGGFNYVTAIRIKPQLSTITPSIQPSTSITTPTTI